jgi:hypothetical protein
MHRLGLQPSPAIEMAGCESVVRYGGLVLQVYLKFFSINCIAIFPVCRGRRLIPNPWFQLWKKHNLIPTDSQVRRSGRLTPNPWFQPWEKT